MGRSISAMLEEARSSGATSLRAERCWRSTAGQAEHLTTVSFRKTKSECGTTTIKYLRNLQIAN